MSSTIPTSTSYNPNSLKRPLDTTDRVTAPPTRLVRASTEAQRALQEHQPHTKTHRIISSPSKAATVMQGRGVEHVCRIDPESAAYKAQARMCMIFIRFLVTQFFNCETKRAPTKLQAGQSHCGNCHAAHFALTPSLEDTAMTIATKKVSDPSKPITPRTKEYLRARLGTPNVENLVNLSTEAERTRFIGEHTERRDRHSSFHGTAFEQQLSGTVEGPIAANRLDMSLERKMRDEEDRLSDEISNKTNNPQTAISTIYTALVTLLKQAIEHVPIRIQQIRDYHALEQQLYTIEDQYIGRGEAAKEISEDDLANYDALVAALLQKRTELQTRRPFCSPLARDKFWKVSSRKDFFLLRAYNMGTAGLTTLSGKRKHFSEHIIGVTSQRQPPLTEQVLIKHMQERLEEAQGQLAGMEAMGECSLANLDIALFGVVEEGKRRRPTEEELYSQLCEMTRKVSHEESSDVSCPGTPVGSPPECPREAAD